MSERERLEADYNAAVANGLGMKARAIGRHIDALDRQAAPAEPTTAVGRRYALHPPGSLDEWERAILAIEAEARQPSPVAERSTGLREAAERVLSGSRGSPEWYRDVDTLAALAADPAAQPERLDVERLAAQQRPKA